MVTGEIMKIVQVMWQVVMVVSFIAPEAKQLAIRHPLLVVHIFCLENVYACRFSTLPALQPWHLGGNFLDDGQQKSTRVSSNSNATGTLYSMLSKPVAQASNGTIGGWRLDKEAA